MEGVLPVERGSFRGNNPQAHWYQLHIDRTAVVFREMVAHPHPFHRPRFEPQAIPSSYDFASMLSISSTSIPRFKSIRNSYRWFFSRICSCPFSSETVSASLPCFYRDFGVISSEDLLLLLQAFLIAATWLASRSTIYFAHRLNQFRFVHWSHLGHLWQLFDWL